MLPMLSTGDSIQVKWLRLSRKPILNMKSAPQVKCRHPAPTFFSGDVLYLVMRHHVNVTLLTFCCLLYERCQLL